MNDLDLRSQMKGNILGYFEEEWLREVAFYTWQSGQGCRNTVKLDSRG